MHPDGAALSDVWMDLVVDPQDRMPLEVFARILQLCPNKERARLLLLAPEETPCPSASGFSKQPSLFAFDPLGNKTRERRVPDNLINRLHRAPCLEVLKAIPSGTVDLAFADPPFNLTKAYNGYADDRDEGDYIGWCKRWLVEYERVLKPGGALVVLNLPRWSVWLADFLCRTSGLYLQNWIVWNSLPEPKGVLMPAHYALLYFTKGKTPARFNYCSMENGWQPFDEAVFPPDRPDVCQRRSCVRERRASSETWRGELTDVWHDIHRERRAAQKATKAHPCRTPERLLDRIIRLTTNPGDLVLDAFAGTGTSALVAQRLGRRFIAIEQDYGYLRVAEKRLGEQETMRQRPPRTPRRNTVSRRSLQLELRRLALLLGRLPTRADVETFSDYRLEAFDAAFTSWTVALKAAKVTVSSLTYRAVLEKAQMNLFKTASASQPGSDSIQPSSPESAGKFRADEIIPAELDETYATD